MECNWHVAAQFYQIPVEEIGGFMPARAALPRTDVIDASDVILNRNQPRATGPANRDAGAQWCW